MNPESQPIERGDRSTPPDFGAATNQRERFANEWETKRLGDHVRFLRHGINPRSDLTSDGTVGYLHYGDIHTATHVHLNPSVWSMPTLTRDRARFLDRLEVGDVVFVDASEDLGGVGKSVEIRELEGREIVSGLHTIAARFDKAVLADGFKAYLQFCPALQRHLRRLAAGTKVYATSRVHIASADIPLPPLPEQRAIAAVLSDVDALVGSLEVLIAKKRAIKRAAMQQLLTGRTRLPGFEGEWETKRIDALAEVDPENLPSRTDPEFAFNYISLDHVDAGRLLGCSRETFATAPSRARRVLRPGDVLMSTVRPALQGHLLFFGQIPDAVCSTGFAVLRTKRNDGDPRFLFAHLFGDGVAAQVRSLLAGSNYPAINSGDIGGLRVTCPPSLAEQRTIANVLSDMDAEIASLEQRLDKTRAIKQGMMQQLLTGAVRLPTPDDELGGESHDA